MTREKILDIESHYLSEYIRKSHTWDDIKDYLIMNLPVDDSTEIICEIERYNKGSKKFSPRNDRYYFLCVNRNNDDYKINIRRDKIKSPLSDFEKERNKKMDYRYRRKLLNS